MYQGDMSFEIHGTKGAIKWNMERMNELQLQWRNDAILRRIGIVAPLELEFIHTFHVPLDGTFGPVNFKGHIALVHFENGRHGLLEWCRVINGAKCDMSREFQRTYRIWPH